MFGAGVVLGLGWTRKSIGLKRKTQQSRASVGCRAGVWRAVAAKCWCGWLKLICKLNKYLIQSKALDMPAERSVMCACVFLGAQLICSAKDLECFSIYAEHMYDYIYISIHMSQDCATKCVRASNMFIGTIIIVRRVPETLRCVYFSAFVEAFAHTFLFFRFFKHTALHVLVRIFALYENRNEIHIIYTHIFVCMLCSCASVYAQINTTAHKRRTTKTHSNTLLCACACVSIAPASFTRCCANSRKVSRQTTREDQK